MRASALLGMILALSSSGCAQREKHIIHIQGMAFVPPSLSIAPGDLVIWQNDDLVPHTVVATPRFDSGNIAPEATFQVTLGQPGEIHYVCNIHPGMAGTITVQKR